MAWSTTIHNVLLLLIVTVLPVGTCYQGWICSTTSSRTGHRLLERQRSDDPANRELTLVRLNKVFKKTHSRRQADQLIQAGRVAVNGKTSYGTMVKPHQDVVTLDGILVHDWEQLIGTQEQPPQLSDMEYIKYHKPRGITCTTDRRIKGNIVDEIQSQNEFHSRHRLFPVGRLDKESTGLILMTSDGRLPNAHRSSPSKLPKVYLVTVDTPHATLGT